MEVNFFPSIYLIKFLYSLGILAGAIILSALIKKTIDFAFHSVKRHASGVHLISKTRTIRALLKNICDGIFIVVALLIALSNYGIDIRPILAGAGIVGLALSLGSQTLVKDFLAGFFIIVEDQFNIGDRVKIGLLEGTVDKITLRLTVLRDQSGNLIYIPNSQILTVIKYTDTTVQPIVKS